MIDSGASHELQHLWPDSPVPPSSVPTSLGLAVDEAKGKVYMDNEGVAHAVSKTEFQPLFPINVYVRELDLKWLSSRDRSALVLPDGSVIELVIDTRDGSIYISEVQAEVLRSMRRARRNRSCAIQIFEKAKRAVVATSLEEHRAAGHPHFRHDCPECRAAAGRHRPHWRLDEATRPGGQVSGDISGPHPAGRFPSDRQEDLPRRPRYFLLFAFVVQRLDEQELAKVNQRFAKDGPVKLEPKDFERDEAEVKIEVKQEQLEPYSGAAGSAAQEEVAAVGYAAEEEPFADSEAVVSRLILEALWANTL